MHLGAGADVCAAWSTTFELLMWEGPGNHPVILSPGRQEGPPWGLRQGSRGRSFFLFQGGELSAFTSRWAGGRVELEPHVGVRPAALDVSWAEGHKSKGRR